LSNSTQLKISNKKC